MPPVAPAPGDVIEDYEILEKVGGNMGLVFKARHLRLNKLVALKLLPADWMADPARLARFQREIRVMGQFEHPNLVTAADARSVDPWHLVAMEWIDGVDLQRLVRTQGPLPIAVACEAARQAALGLDHASQHGLIHRDIKPSNLMVTRSGTIKVIDLGLAHTNDDTTAHLTHTGLVLGTMTYCAPEQSRDAANVDIRADIYSLGCTLYHLLTGKAPYCERKALSFPEVVQAHLNEPFPSLADARPDAPAGLETVLARMTAKDPASRFATPREVAEALVHFAQGADLKGLVPARTQEDPTVRVPTGKTPLTPGRQLKKDEAQARWRRIAALLLVLLLGIAAGVLLPVNRPTPDPAVPTRDPVNVVPVILVVDTAADRGVYDEENKGKGITNGEELRTVLSTLQVITRTELISVHWATMPWRGEARVLAARPDVVLIHRSAFFHPIAAELQLQYPPFTNAAASNLWTTVYEMCDVALSSFLSSVGSQLPRTKFLIYSRGTDVRWTNANFRVQWTRDLEERFPWMKDRVSPMWIREGKDGKKASFRNAETAEDIRNWVKTNLLLPQNAK